MSNERQWRGNNHAEMQAFCGERFVITERGAELLVPDPGCHDGMSHRALAIGDWVITLRNGKLTNCPAAVHNTTAR